MSLVMESDLQARDRIGVQDFVLLEDFKSEDAFLDNLRKRYNSGLIYVSIERRENLLNYTKVWFDSRGAHLQRASNSTLHSRTELDSSTRFFIVPKCHCNLYLEPYFSFSTQSVTLIVNTSRYSAVFANFTIDKAC